MNMISFPVHAGIISIATLKQTLEALRFLRISKVAVGCDQTLLIDTRGKNVSAIKEKLNQILVKTKRPVLSSALIPSDSTWLRAEHYFELIDFIEQIDLEKWSIGLFHKNQSIVGFDKADINFLAADLPDHWILRCQIRSSIRILPFYVQSNMIGEFIKLAQTFQSIEHFMNLIENQYSKTSIAIDENYNLDLDEPNELEGFFEFEGQNFFGIFDENRTYDVEMLESLCLVCEKTNSTSITITSWHSILIPLNATSNHRDFKALVRNYSLNTRHSGLDIYWQITSPHYFNLQKTLKSQLRKSQIPTTSFSLGKQSKTNARLLITQLETSPIVRNRYNLYIRNKDTYGLKYTLSKSNLTIKQLSEQIKNTLMIDSSDSSKAVILKKKPAVIEMIYECRECMTQYNPVLGEPAFGIKPGTAFTDLPHDFICPTCEAQLTEFKKVNKELAIVM